MKELLLHQEFKLAHKLQTVDILFNNIEKIAEKHRIFMGSCYVDDGALYFSCVGSKKSFTKFEKEVNNYTVHVVKFEKIFQQS